jgi:cytochrome c peroxidase
MATDDPALDGAFRTPGLRNVALRAPYMHAGQFANLEDVVGHYAKSPAATVGHSELAGDARGHAGRKRIDLTETQARDVAAFLRSLSSDAAQGASSVHN